MNYPNHLSRRKFIQNSSLLAGSMLLPCSGRSMDSGNASGKITVTDVEMVIKSHYIPLDNKI
jgi:hypothetical protein